MSVRVVITDAEERAVLGACRGLAAAGYRVSAVARLRPAATHWSRACAERVLLPDPRDGMRTFADGLAELLGEAYYAALIPGSDASLLAISEHRDLLEPLTRLGLPAREAVRDSMDKCVLQGAAAAAGLSMPPSRVCGDALEATEAAAELGYPVVLKPTASFVRSGDRLRQVPVAVVDGASALVDAAPRYAPQFIVQRYEHARFLSCTGVMADGRLLALTTSRVLRLWPAAAGMHTFSETIEVPPGLADRARALLASLGWQGIFQLQMLEPEAGRFAVIDLNPRVFASIALDAQAGANLAAVWCDWLRSRSGPPVLARAGLRYRWEEGELCHLAWLLRQRRLRAAVALLLPHRRVTHAWFRLRDPMPLLARALYLARRAIRRGAPSRSRALRAQPCPQERAISG